MAVTDWFEFIVTVHEPTPLHPAPDQPLKLDPDAAVAVSVTVVPAVNVFEHAPGHAMPLPVTLPKPVPASPIVSVCVGGGLGGELATNVAVTERAEFIVTMHVPVPPQPAPDHPAKLDPAGAEPVKVIFVPAGKSCEQLLEQLSPPPVTRPEPLPASVTVRG